MLGICVIYLVPDADSAMLLPLALKKIRETTQGNYKIYGCALRLSGEQETQLRESGVELPVIPDQGLRGSLEHSYYLDHLLDHAFADGCSHVATFDMDSWPLLPGWNLFYQQMLCAEAPVAAMVRSEVGDNFPFAAFTMIDKSFWEIGKTSFSTSLRATYDQEITDRISRRVETGSGIMARLMQLQLCFFPLYRTNAWNPHALMCGVYADAFFHLGAGSRAPEFISDTQEFSLNGNPLRSDYRFWINASRRGFFLNALREREEAFLQELLEAAPALRPPIRIAATQLGTGIVSTAPCPQRL